MPYNHDKIHFHEAAMQLLLEWSLCLWLLFYDTTEKHLWHTMLKTLSLRQNGWYFANNIFRCIFVQKIYLFWFEFHAALIKHSVF